MRRSLVLALVLSGCWLGNKGPGGSDGGNVDDQTAKDLAAYTQLAQSLEGGRSPFLPKNAGSLYASGKRVFWKTYPGIDPELHSRDMVSGASIDYGFSIGSGDYENYRASPSLIVTALPAGDKIRYLAYDATQPAHALGEVDFTAPGDGQRWFAYAVNGNTLYVVTTGSATTLTRWSPGDAAATVITTLESAGVKVGEFLDFDVEGDTVIFIESGRLWRLSIASNHATWLQNKTEIAGAVNFGSDGVIFEQATGLADFVYGSSTLRDLSAELAASSYQLNDTYKNAHRFYSATTHENFTRWRDWVIYTASSGIFGYNLTTGAIAPVLLSPINGDLRIEYRYPVAMDDGTCFIVGLESTSGAVGAEGPVWQVRLPALLQ